MFAFCSENRCKKVLRYWGSTLKRESQVAAFVSQSEKLKKVGWKYGLVMEQSCNNPQWEEALTSSGIEIFYRPRPNTSIDWRCIYGAFQLCRKFQPDVVHVDNIHLSPIIGAFLGGPNKRIWWKRSMSSAFEECRPMSLRDRIAPSMRLTAFLSAKVVCVSKAVANELESFGISRDKLAVIANPQLNGLSFSATQRVKVRSQLGVAPHEILGLTIGHAVPVKGWEFLVRAYGKALRLNDHSRLAFVGSTNCAQEVSTFERVIAVAEQLTIRERLIFTGVVDNVSHVLSAADFFVLPSRAEGCSNALIEALQVGLPSIATKVGMAEELLSGISSCQLVERESVEELSSAIAKTIRYCESPENISRAPLLPNFILSLDEYQDQVTEMYQSVLRRS